MADYERLAERLDQIAEELDDIAFDQLREAVADGEVERPRSDKTLMQARRAVAKASHLLRSITE
jgi:predicted transcriptional regulator